MALILKDRVLESSTSTGNGLFTLTGAQTGYQSFSAIGNGNTTYYTIQGKNSDGTLTGEWEVGVGTWSTGNTLSRDTVLSNSLGTTAKIVFSAGAKDVFCDYPASKSVNQNADNKVLIPYTSGVTNVGSLNVGNATSHTDSGVIAAFTASEPLYLYTSLQNTSTANTSYASYAVNDGGHTSYGELGINNSNYSYSAAGFPNNTFSAPLATFIESYGGPLAIGTWDSQKISFIVNGSVNTADAMTINAAGTITIPSLTASQAVFTDASKNLISKATTGTGSVVLNNASDPSIAYLPTFLSNLVINGTYAGATPGTNSTVFGHSNAIVNNYGDSNTVIGYQALENDASNGSNTVVGTYAFKNYIAGPDNDGSNTIIGADCFQFAQNSDFTTAIGAGITLSFGVLGTRSGTYIGAGIQATGNNEIVIGANITGKGDNTTLIGNAQSVTYFPTTVITGTYTVATLPNSTATGRVVGARAFVTNALSPAFGVTAVGGGAVGVPVYYDGTSWKVG